MHSPGRITVLANLPSATLGALLTYLYRPETAARVFYARPRVRRPCLWTNEYSGSNIECQNHTILRQQVAAVRYSRPLNQVSIFGLYRGAVCCHMQKARFRSGCFWGLLPKLAVRGLESSIVRPSDRHSNATFYCPP
jgi:hypothetical protein